VLEDDLARESFADKTNLMNANHTTKITELLEGFVAESQRYLVFGEKVQSVSEAHTQLGLLGVYDEEAERMLTSTVAPIQSLGQEILSARYGGTSMYTYTSCTHAHAHAQTKREMREMGCTYTYTHTHTLAHSHTGEGRLTEWQLPEQDVVALKKREADVGKRFEDLGELSKTKRHMLDDHLAREEFRARVNLQNKQHKDGFDKLKAWQNAKAAYMNAIDSDKIDSVMEATRQISLLESFDVELKQVSSTSVQLLKELGGAITSAKYKSGRLEFHRPICLGSRPMFEPS